MRKIVLLIFGMVMLISPSSYGNQQNILIVSEGYYNFTQLVDFFKKNSYQADMVNLNYVPITDDLLSKYTQFWFFGSIPGGHRSISETEVNSLITFQKNGGSLLLAADHQSRFDQYCPYGGDYTVNFDQFAKAFGVECIGCMHNTDSVWSLFSPNIVQHEIWDNVTQIIGHDSECEMKIDPSLIQTLGSTKNGYPILAVSEEKCSQGRVVFDSTFTRYMDGLFYSGDDARYALNIAKWLSEKKTCNQSPIANAGIDQRVEIESCDGATVLLNALASYDPDGDPLTYKWTWGGGSAEGTNPTITLPFGTSTITLTVEDGKGLSSSDTVDVTVVDTTPPVLNVSVTPTLLWPPNHQYVNIATATTVNDACIERVHVELLSAASNEPDNGLGDGDMFNDIKTGSDGYISFRAERSGTGNGRIYTISYEATDAGGNSVIATATVTVPHNNK